MSELPTPQDVIDYWIGEASASPDAAGKKHKLWFGKSQETDAEIRKRFGELLETLSDLPSAEDWAARGPRERLAVIIVLDQFSRNLYRDEAKAFEQDSLALLLCKDGLALKQDKGMSEVERIFFYLPLEHSEVPEDQERSVSVFTDLLVESREGFRNLIESTLQYAKDHKKVIDEFGRFPHRNKALGRESTDAEKEWLAEGGGF
ncbi:MULTISPECIES: DUF924 family protein [unclassified Hyphomonas]|jgi:uncharacterized protein (DUF924 family)|uniref:DUF924 family protein n=1 Tax=unclassified Hyphomonas TaxID=2630699 RepID=UPI000458B97D|nr:MULTISPECIES: DUF924 family protein [unclassified Hyphomonas]KCZ45702.1 hypothetical protein HY17_12325 [Hyphomonas sp. CY54-11-8]RAN42127.1 hypothetical protein HY26_00770 [Hyphomonas sp. GM-8P]